MLSGNVPVSAEDPFLHVLGKLVCNMQELSTSTSHTTFYPNFLITVLYLQSLHFFTTDAQSQTKFNFIIKVRN